MIDLRLATGQTIPRSLDTPIVICCPFHTDPVESLGVYWDHLYCYGCHKFVRQQAGLALLLGVWDGRPETEYAAVLANRDRFQSKEFQMGALPPRQKTTAVPLPDPKSFADYMWKFQMPRVEAELMGKRGLSGDTIRAYGLGHTGSHFSIPVRNAGRLITIRFRADTQYTYPFPKYSGVYGHNQTTPYCLSDIRRLDAAGHRRQVWIVEGEFDAMAVNQAGPVAQTLTNGALQLDRLPDLLLSSVPGLQVDEWIIATDPDEAGDKAAHALKKLLNGTSKRAVWEGDMDVGELLAKGARIEDIKLDRDREVSLWPVTA